MTTLPPALKTTPTPRAPLTLNPLLYYFFYVAIVASRLTGVINFAYDYRRQRFVLHSRWSKIYCGLLHATHCILLPLCCTAPTLTDAAYQRRAFYVTLNNVITILRLPALLFTLLGTWLRRRQLYDVISAFERLRRLHFHTLLDVERRQILRLNDRRLMVKIITSVAQIVTFFVRIFLFNYRQPSWKFVALSAYFGLLESLTIFVANSFYLGMLYANCGFRYVNAELSRVCNGGGGQEPWYFNDTASVALDRLARIHVQICMLTTTLRHIYQVQIVAILISIFAGNISLFFSLIVWFNGSRQGVNVVLLLFLLNVAFINVIDIWLLTLVCSDTINMSHHSPLDMLTDLSALDMQLQQSVEQLSLSLKCHRLQLPMCGLFNLSSETAYLLTKATVIYLIILVQFDYKNL